MQGTADYALDTHCHCLVKEVVPMQSFCWQGLLPDSDDLIPLARTRQRHIMHGYAARKLQPHYFVPRMPKLESWADAAEKGNPVAGKKCSCLRIPTQWRG
jgi:hypothetical protein